MGWYDQDDDLGAASLQQWADQAAVAPTAKPGFFSGIGTGTVTGLAQGVVAQPALALADWATPKLTPLAASIDEYFGGTTAQDYLKAEQKKTTQAVKDLMPGPDMGLGGQILYGVGAVVPQAVAGTMVAGPAGAAALTGYIQGHAAMRMGEEYEGLDHDTAAMKGWIEGGAAALGVALPAALGAKILTKAATGAGLNVGVGMAQRGGTAALLESRGYAEQAKQYQAFDAESIIVDAVLGGTLGAVLGGKPTQVAPSVIAEAFAKDKQQHLGVSTAPGVPADAISRTAHGKAIDEAVDALLHNRPVDVSASGVDSAAFVPNKASMQASVEAAVSKGNLGSLLDEVDALRRQVEERGLTPADEAMFAGEKLQQAADTLDAHGARDLPGQVVGRAGEVFVGEKQHPVRFLVVEADGLAATIKKADNQFRDRTRASSELQIQTMSRTLQFGRLGDAPSMGEGAPTIAAGGEVVGGNGRLAAIQRAYNLGQGIAYKAALEQRAAEFGLKPAEIAGMTNPVLVRQFTQPIDVKAAAILSNESAGLRMSALEQAKVDAERMPHLPELPESGDLTAASLRDFVGQWLSRYPQSELGEFTDANGKLSPQGEKRLQGAVLYKAYGDSPTLARLIEATDDLSRNLTSALVKAAPTVADTRAAIERGDLHDLDIQPHLLQAVDLTQTLRQTGQKLDDYLAQHDMFGSGIGAEATLLAQHFQSKARSAKALGEALTGYYDRVRALGDPRQESMFAMPPPARGELLRSVLKGDVLVVKAADGAIDETANRILSMTEDDYIATINPTGERRTFDEPMPAEAFAEVPTTGTRVGGGKTRDGRAIELIENPDLPGAIVAVIDGKAAGYMAPESGTTSLFVADELRGQGVGQALSETYRARDPFAQAGSLSDAGEKTARKAFRALQQKYRDMAARQAEPALSADDGLAEFTLEGDTRVELPEHSDADKAAIADLGSAIGTAVRDFVLEPARTVASGDVARGLQDAADLAERLFGKRVVAVDQPGRKVFNGAQFHRYPGLIFLAADNQRPHMAVLGHELVHSMRQDHPDLYFLLRADLRDALIGKGAYAARVNESRAKKGLAPLDDAIVTEEMVADTAGDMFMDGNFWLEFQKHDESKFRAVAKYVRDFIVDTMLRLDGLMAATGWRPFKSEQIMADMDGARQAVAKRMAEYSKRQKPEAKEAPASAGTITFPDGTVIDTAGMETIVAQAMDDTPNLRVITDHPYPTSAALEGERADMALDQAAEDAPGYTAAAACAARTGS